MPDTTTALAETEELLLTVRQQHKTLPWCNVPQLIKEVNTIKRQLKSDELQTQRVQEAERLLDIIWRVRGGWQSLRGHAPAPVWLREGHARQKGTQLNTTLQEFFQGMKHDAKLRTVAEAGLGKPWKHYQNIYQSYLLLCRREEQAHEQKQEAVKRLWYFLKILRATLKLPEPRQ